MSSYNNENTSSCFETKTAGIQDVQEVRQYDTNMRHDQLNTEGSRVSFKMSSFPFVLTEEQAACYEQSLRSAFFKRDVLKGCYYQQKSTQV